MKKISELKISEIFPLYLKKIVKKNYTESDLFEIITWLTSINQSHIRDLIKQDVTFEQFFSKAELNPNAELITGIVCGVRVEEIEDPLTQKIRYLDKLVDELAKGKDMQKILRRSGR